MPAENQTEDDEMVPIKELKQLYISGVFDLEEIPYSIKEQKDMKTARKQRNLNNNVYINF